VTLPVRLAALLALSLLLTARWQPAAAADDPFDIVGHWLTQDRGGVIGIARCGESICARIVGLVLDRPTDPMPLDSRGASQCGLELINDAQETGLNLWRGHIRDPRNGKVFGVELWLKPDGSLGLRGFVGITLLGRTETWTRYAGPVPPNCRLSPTDLAPRLPKTY